MSPLSQAGLLLVNVVFGFITVMFALRFMLKWARANFFNPISQSVVQFTNPILQPLHRLLPNHPRLDIGALLVAWVLIMIKLSLLAWFAGGSPGILALVTVSLINFFSLCIWIMLIGILIMVIASWLAPNSNHPALNVIETITRPVMWPVQRHLPLRFGGIDFTPIIAILGLQLIQILILSPAAAYAATL